ncbi:MAG: hypothetical protein QM774_10035 [Gordonia sp. (in: high G+C Gram-positive bacteria)]|uniref:hypothetical protein n=1 Tax=Gordonia sp. (in: high G+C Gram-positive bacteria) TaxID=84139 RepID=UPI0039E47818
MGGVLRRAAPPAADGRGAVVPRGRALSPDGDATASPAAPASIRLAVRLMYLGAVLQLVSMVVSIYTLGHLKTDPALQEQYRKGAHMSADEFSRQVDTIVGNGRILVSALSVAAAALWLVMAVYNGRGRRWARTAATALGAIGVIFSATGLFASGGTAGLISGVVSIVLAIAVLILLYRPDSTRYYEQRDAELNPAA